MRDYICTMRYHSYKISTKPRTNGVAERNATTHIHHINWNANTIHPTCAKGGSRRPPGVLMQTFGHTHPVTFFSSIIDRGSIMEWKGKKLIDRVLSSPSARSGNGESGKFLRLPPAPSEETRSNPRPCLSLFYVRSHSRCGLQRGILQLFSVREPLSNQLSTPRPPTRVITRDPPSYHLAGICQQSSVYG